MNTPQIFTGTCESMTPVSYGRDGKQLIRLVVSAEVPKRKGADGPDRISIPFSLFGRPANHARAHFQEGHDAIVWYNLGARIRGEFTNINLDVVRVLITPPEGYEQAKRPPIGRDRPEGGPVDRANQAAAEANAQRTEDDDVPF